VNDTPETPENEDETPRPVSVHAGPTISITKEMKTSYLDYAMSVIVSRAIPDLRAGLKPLHRRILYAMHEPNHAAANAYRNAAPHVSRVIGQYPPPCVSSLYHATEGWAAA